MEITTDKPVQPLKTYVNKRKILAQVSSKPESNVLLKREPLTTKKAVELFLSGTLKNRVCRFCLHTAFPLSELDQLMHIAGRGALYSIKIRDIVASFYPFQVVDDSIFPSNICNKCLNQAIRSYLFAQQCEQAERAIRNCFEDIFDKIEKLDPLEKVKKRGRQKLNPNYNTLYTDHTKVMDYAEPIMHLINSGSTSLTKEPQMSDLECKKCWQVLPNIESLINHEKKHPKTMWYNCRICGKSFVKCIQLKRHLRIHNSKDISLVTSEASDFICKQCDFVSENYLLHLQHIEKHKFQMVFEHLVEKKMDKLCVVCMDKGNLQALDKVISLHGGYPELTGDRSIINILGSTIPEKKSYKYQELLVPCEAKVLTITKKMATIANKDNETIPNVKTNHNKVAFEMSYPIIINKNTTISSDDLYLFCFSKPHKVNDNEIIVDDEENKRKIEIFPIKYNDSSKTVEDSSDDDNLSVDKMLNNINNIGITYTFHQPNYLIDEDTLQKIVINDDRLCKAEFCKLSWPFREPISLNCNNKTSIDEEVFADNSTIPANNTINQFGTCQLCWVFKKVGRCDFCKQTQMSDSIVVEEFRINNNFRKIGKLNTELKHFNEEVVRKRKVVTEDFGVKPKKTKWQCAICLFTNNSDRETCLCCDFAIQNSESANIKYSFNNLNFLGDVKKIKSHLLVETGVKTTQPTEKKEEQNLHEIDKDTNGNGKNNINLTMETDDTAQNVQDNDSFKPMFTESVHVAAPTVTTNFPSNVYLENQDIMDVEETSNNEILKPLTAHDLTSIQPAILCEYNTTKNENQKTLIDNSFYIQHTNSNFTNIELPTFPANSFQFNIGSTPSEPKSVTMKKIKRHAKRMLTSHPQ